MVGPNGSGKSNVVDAIRWVMGEQSAKHLRGGAMQDVIFAGSQKRPALGMASVFLTFDNSDGRAPAEYSNYAEITVGRRLYRSGESEYYINKTPCRLKDVIDLFLGTGTGTKAYSIVEQGQIGLIVSAKPEDRRLLIEEAAGISKFKYRREAAQRKMEATRGNLLRLRDITSELDRQIQSLQRQVKKAERYQRLTEELRQLELSEASHQWTTWRSTVTEIETRCVALREEEGSVAAQLGQCETAIETGRLTLAEIERELSATQERAYALQNTIHLLEATITHKTQEIEDVEARGKTAVEEVTQLAVRREEWLHALTTANDEKVTVDLATAVASEEAEQLEQEVAQVNAQLAAMATTAQDVQQRVVQCVQHISVAETGRQHATQRAEEFAADVADGETQVTALELQLTETRRLAGEEATALDTYRQLSMRLDEERDTLVATLQQQEAELARLEGELEEQRSVLERAASRLHSLEELAGNFEGYHEGVRAILQQQGGASPLAGVLGDVAQIVETAPEYERAVGAILGERIQGIVVESHQSGVAALAFLKEASRGRGTFIPRTLRTTSRVWPDIADAGVVGPLTHFVRFHDDDAAVGQYLIGDVLLVRDLTTALRLWEEETPPATYVTLDGEMVDAAGVITGGGSADHAAGILARRRELEGLRPDVIRLRTAVEATENIRQRVVERVQHLQAQVGALSQSRHDTEIDLVNRQKDLDHRQREVERISAEQAQAAHDLAERRRLQAQAVREGEMLRVTLCDAIAAREAAEAQLAQCRAGEAACVVRRDAMQAALHERRTILASHEERARAVEKEIQRLVEVTTDAVCTMERKQLDIEEGKTVVVAARREIVRQREELGGAVQQAEEGSRRQQEIQQRYQGLSEEVRQHEASLRLVRKRHDEATAAKHAIEIELTQQRERIGFLEREISEKYHVFLAEQAADFLQASFDAETVGTQVGELRQKIERLGGVNTDAIGEWEELQQRHTFLVQQGEDLEQSIEALHRAIQKINRISRERFRETFDEIRGRFQLLFPKLFRGGQADLVLTDEDQVLESGIEIVAQPPGKKLQSVTLLSGGEKALTAVALIFAMFLVRPSPFCLLDEVDAPLDDANIDRFNDLIREMTGYSQFILITHNKRTMELADSLYGVTMEEPGVSKLVSVRLNQEQTGPASETVAA